mmetsp:Transcript_42598/g.103033  ORF Transcript_42598/g.103033 Transcript_42598/m.103033 type:complete len:152 (+) Transcript_42598:947-1402(+)
MEVLAKDKSDSPFLLPNAEVIHLLEDRLKSRNEKSRKKQNPKKNKYKHRDWIESQVLEYLKTTPCVDLQKENLETFQSTLMSSKKLKSSGNTASETGFGLTEAEALQVLNFVPKEKVEIHLMVEELHTRMTDDRQDELLQYIQSQSPEIYS